MSSLASKGEVFSSEVLRKLTLKGKMLERTLPWCVLLCPLVSCNALHVAAHCHEAPAPARPVAPASSHVMSRGRGGGGIDLVSQESCEDCVD